MTIWNTSCKVGALLIFALALQVEAARISPAFAQNCRSTTFEGLDSSAKKTIWLKDVGSIEISDADATKVDHWTTGEPVRLCIGNQTDGDLYEITNLKRNVTVRTLITALLKNLN
jgi:hypothetical protein